MLSDFNLKRLGDAAKQLNRLGYGLPSSDRGVGIPHFAPDRYVGGVIDETAIRARFDAMRVRLDERERRLFAAAEARSAGYGGVSAVARATGIARSTIDRGLKDLATPDRAGSKIRRSGGGRPALTRADPTLLEDLRGLLKSTTLGDPTRPLIWVSKSHAKLALALEGLGHRVSATRIPQLLERLGYRRQVNRKSLEGGHHVDRNAQFEYINAQVEAFQAAGQPVISVDTKKKELIGPYKNGGSDYRLQGCPDEVNVYDFRRQRTRQSHSLRSSRHRRECQLRQRRHRSRHRPVRRQTHSPPARDDGRERYPGADRLMITADGGGSNGSRVRLSKVELQKFADETGLPVSVCHYPPGTSKWNKIEHRLFCHITQNWRGRPLTSRSAVVEFIAATTTKKGLTVRCEFDANTYEKGVKVSDAEMAALNIEGDAFHPEWNYTIKPRPREAPS